MRKVNPRRVILVLAEKPSNCSETKWRFVNVIFTYAHRGKAEYRFKLFEKGS